MNVITNTEMLDFDEERAATRSRESFSWLVTQVTVKEP